MKKIHNYTKFLEEIDIKGNPGIPNEGTQEPGDTDYLNNIENRAKTRLDILGEDESDIHSKYGPRIMQLIPRIMQFQRGKEMQLEKLATDAIMNQYGDILNDVELDIKFGNPGDLFKKDRKEEEEEEEENPLPFKEVTSKELLDKIHSAKIYNNIIQGEAINTKTMFHSEFIKDGLNEIFGEDESDKFSKLLVEISETASKIDWLSDLDQKAKAMERDKESGQGFAGAVKVEWKPKKKKEKGQEEVQDVQEEQEEEVQEEEEFTPVIRVRAIDFSMLLHESVKGIYELIAAVSVPGLDASSEEISDAETVKFNTTSMADESSDFRSGPEIASDLRDFINENPKVDKVANMREYVFGKLCDYNYMPRGEFIELFRGILNKKPFARKKIDEIIDEIIQELNDYDYEASMEDPERDSVYNLMNNDVEDDKLSSEEEVPTTLDYSKMKKGEIQKLIDTALDNNDFELLRTLQPYMESDTYKVYSNEVKLFNKKSKK